MNAGRPAARHYEGVTSLATTPARVLFGAAYYHEYQPTDRLEDRPRPDGRGRLHRDPGRRVRLVHLGAGERPVRPRLAAAGPGRRPRARHLGRPGHADLRRPAVAGAAVPGDRRRDARTGQRIAWGARQEVDFTHPAFRFHAERVIRAIIDPVRRPPRRHRIPGGQRAGQRAAAQPRRLPALRRPPAADLRRRGDPEPRMGPGLLVAPAVHLGGSVDAGRQRPAAVRPGLAPVPGRADHRVHRLAGRHRAGVRPRRPVRDHLHRLRPAGDRRRRADRRAWTSPPATPTTRCRTGWPCPTTGAESQTWTTTGTWALYLSADRMYSSRQEPFLVTETNAMHIGYPWNSRPAYDGQWRQAAWALVSRGARMIEYWHWHTLHFGAETYWGGVLPHSGGPGRGLRARWPGSAPSSNGPATWSPGSTRTPTSPWSTRCRASGSCRSTRRWRDADGGPDDRGLPGAVRPVLPRRVRRRAAGADRARTPAGRSRGRRPSDPAARPSSIPVLVVPGLYIADDATLDWLARLRRRRRPPGPRTAHRLRRRRGPGPRPRPRRRAWPTAAGVWYDEFSNLIADVRGRGSAGRAASPAAATRPAPAGSTASPHRRRRSSPSYEHPHFGRWPAVTTRIHGQGRITNVGTVPDQALARALAGG